MACLVFSRRLWNEIEAGKKGSKAFYLIFLCNSDFITLSENLLVLSWFGNSSRAFDEDHFSNSVPIYITTLAWFTSSSSSSWAMIDFQISVDTFILKGFMNWGRNRSNWKKNLSKTECIKNDLNRFLFAHFFALLWSLSNSECTTNNIFRPKISKLPLFLGNIYVVNIVQICNLKPTNFLKRKIQRNWILNHKMQNFTKYTKYRLNRRKVTDSVEFLTTVRTGLEPENSSKETKGKKVL